MKSFRIVFACGTPDAAESLRHGPRSVDTLEPRVRSRAFLDIVSLGTCLVGFIGLIFVVSRMKTGVFGTPRALYLLFIGMTCAPFYVAFVRPPKIPFLFPPVIAIFLLYPIAAPHGIVYSTDPIFNFSFTQDLLRTGFWDPGGGNAFAKTYSFYPIGNVFVGYVILNAPLPPDIGYLWIEPVLRLLAIPACVYSFGRRLFGPRTAAIGVLLYLGTPSILFNDAVQQGFGTIFFALSLLALFMLVGAVDPSAQRRAMLLFAVVSAGIDLGADIQPNRNRMARRHPHRPLLARFLHGHAAPRDPPQSVRPGERHRGRVHRFRHAPPGCHSAQLHPSSNQRICGFHRHAVRGCDPHPLGPVRFLEVGQARASGLPREAVDTSAGGRGDRRGDRHGRQSRSDHLAGVLRVG